MVTSRKAYTENALLAQLRFQLRFQLRSQLRSQFRSLGCWVTNQYNVLQLKPKGHAQGHRAEGDAGLTFSLG
jgi:hypothetical protein